jgi:hypothetical protein
VSFAWIGNYSTTKELHVRLVRKDGFLQFCDPVHPSFVCCCRSRILVVVVEISVAVCDLERSRLSF